MPDSQFDVTYGSPVYAAWREAAGDNWTAYTRHAFVEGLSDGTLPHQSFVYYLVQDYVFLMHYARAWALAVGNETQGASRALQQAATRCVRLDMSHETESLNAAVEKDAPSLSRVEDKISDRLAEAKASAELRSATPEGAEAELREAVSLAQADDKLAELRAELGLSE